MYIGTIDFSDTRMIAPSLYVPPIRHANKYRMQIYGEYEKRQEQSSRDIAKERFCESENDDDDDCERRRQQLWTCHSADAGNRRGF